MSYICANSTYAATLANSSNALYAVVVCATFNTSFPANRSSNATFVGCGQTPESCALGRIWANCTATGPGEYNFEWDDDVYGNTSCSVPTLTLNSNASVALQNVTTVSSAFPDASVFGGSFTGNASMLFAYENATVSAATPIGYFGLNTTTVPASCSHLSCVPTGNASAVPCALLSPNAEACFGSSDACFPTPGGGNLCIETECDWVPNGTAYTSHPNGSYFFPPGCQPFTICEHTTVASIFPDDNTCLCLPGYTNTSASTCSVSPTPDYACSTTEYARLGVNNTFECVELTTCSGSPLIEATVTSDNICAEPPTVCVGFVNASGICVTPRATCTSIQIITGTNTNGNPECRTLSPPCPSHSFEKTPPTPTSDRVCVRYTGVNVYAATAFAISPCIVYFLIMGYVYSR